MNQKISELQKWLRSNNFKACIIPTADPHQSEYTEEYYKLRAYMSGFTGSAGTLVVTDSKAALFTDSRYHIQASIQLQGSGIELMKSGLPGVPEYPAWLKDEVKDAPVAANAALFSTDSWENLQDELNLTDCNAFESLWAGRTPLCDSKIFIHDVKYSGEETQSKLNRVRDILRENGADFCVISNLDDIAWLLNIRGADVAFNPVVRSYVAVTESGCTLFCDEEKADIGVQEYMDANNIELMPYNNIAAYIERMAGKSMLFDRKSLSYNLYKAAEKCKDRINLPLFISRLRAVKNETEIEGYHQSMIKDGVVWVKFLKWFTEGLESGEKITERSVMAKIRELKEAQPLFVDESFGTIAGYAEHGAIGHYAASAESDSVIERKSFIVIDTGTHYLTGTTDTTRTVACGELTDEERTDYTLVLKGHIALGTAIFPVGTKGSQLDILARQFLWQRSMNYGHGTGHGVGHLLNVHEGYAWLRPSENDVKYEAGLTMTDEPGIYREGRHGIRIENTVLVTPHSKSEFGEFLTFEHLTLAPYCLEAIITDMLTPDEKLFINNYNKRLKNTLKEYLSADENLFLEKITYEI
ncbi:MAG: aminopeptidase P family N-terminal domain-containing protein [Paludibacteraceae bacterium]|nr:aminopeptidase P family N-terminal domain-containing protein [Paludibacteraceae bacterium]